MFRSDGASISGLDQRPRLATKHNKSPGQAWGISNPAGLVRRFVQVFRLTLCQNVTHYIAMHIRQPIISARVTIG